MRSFAYIILGSCCVLGCGGYQTAHDAARETAVANNLKQIGLATHNFNDPSGSAGRPAHEVAPSSKPGQAELRKIIYTAQVTLVVEDFSHVETQIAELVQQLDGYVADSNVDRTRGSQRTGKWVVRIAVDRFDPFLDAVVKLGIPENRQTNAQDITEEFVDLEARLVNKKEIERRIIKLLEDRSGDIKDVIAVETELGRVREEIERMEGRLRYLSNVTALTTITITVREQLKYVPAQEPTFTAQIGLTWTQSISSLKEAAKALVLFLVGLAPWLPVIVVLIAPLIWLVRRRRSMPVSRPHNLPAA